MFSLTVMVEDQEGVPPTSMKAVPVQMMQVTYIAPHHLQPLAPHPAAAALLSALNVDVPANDILFYVSQLILHPRCVHFCDKMRRQKGDPSNWQSAK
jgi:hypothetical protein